MGKSMIIEAQDSSLVYEEGQKGVLGKLSGVFANFKKGTRNGDRLYNEELFDKRVFGSEDVIEALETRTLFGELDHPQGDRCETLAQNAAVSIIKLEKDADEGVVKGEALILDTPSGRTLKALVDSGAHMGISSRGIGEEIIQEGQTIIDPDTYDFITFDVVVTPANKGARLSLVESKQKDNVLYKSIEKEIRECSSLNQLDQLKSVVESTVKIGKARLAKLIENKVTALTPDKDIKGNSEDIKKDDKNITSKVQESKTSIEQKPDLLEENKNLIIQLEKLKADNNLLQAKLTESRRNEKKARLSVNKLQESHEKEVKSLKEESLELKEKMNANSLKLMKEMRKVKASHKKEINSLNESIEVEKGKYARLLEANKNMSEASKKSSAHTLTESKKLSNDNAKLIESNNKLLKEVKSLKRQLQESKQSNLAKLTKIQESKNSYNTEITSLKNQLNEANQKVVRLTEASQRVSKLPFNLTSANLKLENRQTAVKMNTDDEALFNTMVQMNSK